MLKEKASNTALVVDDSSFSRDFIARILESLEVIVETAKDGCEAFEKIKQREYNLVISDLNMPQMDGLQLLKKVKSHRPNTHFIVVSAQCQGKLRQDLIAEGSDRVFAKGEVRNLRRYLKARLGPLASI
ncbi:response regulator transcription factor [Pseudobacteriovorax antillogorgiicola]|uniref:Two-component system, chemotaxis family, response regulator CheY n=1 Tax=Pseudobacteriovorax antillogorgiicola TaxID=1513793 RepID=A0A1Y6BFP9_9BACT|nr:response regulator [Pseudobacteriovorax antillogorgiicola]TCS56192.1 two-component system chemotaxis response regulator CheY [Pseudobacteriovorax antillogorgiicola]SMF08817.1 two-component system, chemotaxis family, response regulator CheY [Pseudobacteriovorax antillogorgiicola]